jgi:subtilase family serine protease
MSARLATVAAVLVITLAGCAAANRDRSPVDAVVPPSGTGSAANSERPAASADPVDLGPTPADEQVSFSVSLHLPAADAMTTYVAGLTQPGSASYHKYLSPPEFGAKFGLSDGEVGRVVNWLSEAGLAATAAPQRTSITVDGTAGEVNALLGITLADRESAAGVRYHVPLGEPRIPSELKSSVDTVVGLDTEPLQHPALGNIDMSGVPNPGITPSLVATAYEISPLHDAGFLGDGLNIAIVSFDTFTPEDVPVFDAQMGITGAPQVQKVTLPGGPDTPGSGTGEVALDIQVIRGIAPHAQITSYEGANTSDGLVPIISRIVADGKAKIVSSSWGTCENRNSRSAMQAEQQELAAAVATGISYFSSSGDDAAYDCRRVHVSDNAMERDITPGVDWPAASANVIAVGGTFLTTREDGTYYEEAGWEEPLGGSGSGGGLSKFQQRPSWQQGAGVDNAQTNGMRQVPDVAGPADPSSGFVVIYTDPDQGRVSSKVGGTSAAAPFWASSMLLTQQYAASQGIAQLGPLGPVLYQVAAQQQPGAVFHDVVRGGNLLYQSGSGWDYATGLGSPRVAPLAQAIVNFLKQ